MQDDQYMKSQQCDQELDIIEDWLFKANESLYVSSGDVRHTAVAKCDFTVKELNKAESGTYHAVRSPQYGVCIVVTGDATSWYANPFYRCKGKLSECRVEIKGLDTLLAIEEDDPKRVTITGPMRAIMDKWSKSLTVGTQVPVGAILDLDVGHVESDITGVCVSLKAFDYMEVVNEWATEITGKAYEVKTDFLKLPEGVESFIDWLYRNGYCMSVTAFGTISIGGGKWFRPMIAIDVLEVDHE